MHVHIYILVMLVTGNCGLLLPPGKCKNVFLIFTFLSDLFWTSKAHTDYITSEIVLEVRFNMIL